MIAGINAKIFRPHTVTAGMRQQVAARNNPAISRRMARMVTLILCGSLFCVFILSQFMHWHIMSASQQLDRLQDVRMHAGSENISLLAKKAQLASKTYVVEQAGKKFQLFVPGNDQVKRL